MLHNLGWQLIDSQRQYQRFFYTKLLTDSHWLKQRTSSRQPTPVQGRITARTQIHIGILFSRHSFELEQPSI